MSDPLDNLSIKLPEHLKKGFWYIRNIKTGDTFMILDNDDQPSIVLFEFEQHAQEFIDAEKIEDAEPAFHSTAKATLQ